MKKSVVVIGCMLPAAAMAMADTATPVYGRPTLYGEYETTSADRRRAAAIYGAVPQNAAEKMPVKAKKPVSKNALKKKKAQNRAAKKQKPVPKVVQKPDVEDVIVVPPHDIVPTENVEKKPIVPSDTAVAIAAVAGVPDAPSIESFCTQRRSLHRGELPDGIILMPGRPDLMSCSDK